MVWFFLFTQFIFFLEPRSISLWQQKQEVYSPWGSAWQRQQVAPLNLHRRSFMPSKCTGWPNWLCKRQALGQRYPIYVRHILRVPNFNLFPSTGSRFKLQVILGQVHWMTPKWHWNTRSKLPHICSISPPESQFTPVGSMIAISKITSILTFPIGPKC